MIARDRVNGFTPRQSAWLNKMCAAMPAAPASQQKMADEQERRRCIELQSQARKLLAEEEWRKVNRIEIG